ncbi:hypothetical protein [Catenulispora pinisilvae]|uniref:hypothetical protein n=1 Tax=Catenulispora pinisilvae TaxID=2705253 RepID=UPI00189276AD|nr:hypothetical protein [Catenulispora pinisilvae]
MTAVTIAAIVSLVLVTLCLALVVCALSLIGKSPDKDPDAPPSAIWRRPRDDRRAS